MFAVTIFCMGSIAYVLWTGLDTKAAEAAVTMAFATLLGTVGSYVFGATWEDNSSRALQAQAGSGLGYGYNYGPVMGEPYNDDLDPGKDRP